MKNKVMKTFAALLAILIILPMFNVVDSQAATAYTRRFESGGTSSSDQGVYMNTTFISPIISFSSAGKSYSNYYYKVYYNDKQVYKSGKSGDFAVTEVSAYFSVYDAPSLKTSAGYLKSGTYKVKYYSSNGTQIGSAVCNVYNSSSTKGWVQKDGVWFYFVKNGQKAEHEWKTINGKKYYFDYGGAMATGHYEVIDWGADNFDDMFKYYLFDSTGALITGGGWKYVDGDWYYPDASGELATKWKAINGTWYYFWSDGRMAHDCVVLTYDANYEPVPGEIYFVGSSGAMITSAGWQCEVYHSSYDNQTYYSWYYLNAGGKAKTGWLNDGGTWYYLDPTWGYMYYGGWAYIGGAWYYFNNSGAMQTGWIQDGGKWYYLESSGAMATNKWIGNYYVDSTGVWTKSK